VHADARVPFQFLPMTTKKPSPPLSPLTPFLAIACLAFSFASSARAQNAAPQLVDDTVTVSNTSALLYPLANDTDPEGDLLTISSVSEPSVTIQGRRLTVPPTVNGTFTYQATDGTNTATATVTVNHVTATPRARRFIGLLFDANGAIAGRVKLLDTRTGMSSLELLIGTRRVAGRVMLGATGGRATTTLGTLVLTRKPDGTINATVGELIGLLRPGPTTTTPGFFHVALASIGNLNVSSQTPRGISPPPTTTRIAGGGYSLVRLRANGTATVTGRLPDGVPFTIGAFVSDVKSIPLFAAENTGTTARGTFGGELLLANLPLTDITGELAWSKPVQSASAKYPYKNGVDTILQANGCLFTSTPINGQGALQLQGGNLTRDESYTVAVTNGRPAAVGSLAIWSPRPQGTFLVKVVVPYSINPAIGMGLLLPKSKQAWGYFPGPNEGGRVALRLQVQPE